MIKMEKRYKNKAWDIIADKVNSKKYVIVLDDDTQTFSLVPVTKIIKKIKIKK